jgi:hypothetical protein
MSASTDVEQALLAAWKTAGLNGASAPAGSPGGGPGTGPITGGIYTDRNPRPRPAVPYATLTVRKDGRTNEWQSDGQYIDYRRAKVVIYGVGKTALGGIVSQVLAGLWKKADGTWIPLVIPNAVGWLRTELVSDDIDLDGIVAGDDVRSAPLELVIWSQRKQA